MYFGEIYSKYDDFIPSPDDVVLDAGAQFGDYALLCAGGFGVSEVIAFEPVKRNFEILESNIALNGFSNVKAHHLALGETESTMEIFHENDMANKYGYGTPEMAHVRTVDSLPIKRVTFMKIDVEGFEMELLRGALETIRKNRPRIIIETHSRELDSEVKEFLANFGYKLKHTVKNSPPKGRKEMNQVMNRFYSPC